MTCADEKYHMLPSGELLVRDVSADDVSRPFLCRTVHLLTDQHVISRQPARVGIRGQSGMAGVGDVTAQSWAKFGNVF